MLPSELIAVVRPSICKKNTCSSSRTMPKYIVADHAMEMRLEVRRIDYRKPNIPLCKKDTMEAPIVYETLVKACSRSNVKGLYCFNTGGTALESLTKIYGTYILLFTLVRYYFTCQILLSNFISQYKHECFYTWRSMLILTDFSSNFLDSLELTSKSLKNSCLDRELRLTFDNIYLFKERSNCAGEPPILVK